METRDILLDAFGRIGGGVARTLQGARQEQLDYRPDPDANPVGWLVWHLTRVMDDHVSEIADREQVWTADGWARRFDLPLDDAETGYGHTREQVAQVRASAELLLSYHEAVQEQCAAYLRGIEADELDRIIDPRWDPPVSVGVRLVSVVADALQHLGQADYVMGLFSRR